MIAESEEENEKVPWFIYGTGRYSELMAGHFSTKNFSKIAVFDLGLLGALTDPAQSHCPE